MLADATLFTRLGNRWLYRYLILQGLSTSGKQTLQLLVALILYADVVNSTARLALPPTSMAESAMN